jgi:hypothetical protein
MNGRPQGKAVTSILKDSEICWKILYILDMFWFGELEMVLTLS